MTELKKCPFCGGTARMERAGNIGLYIVHCTLCGAEVSFFRCNAADRTQEKVIEAWNRRTADVIRTEWERKADRIQRKWERKKKKRESCPCCLSNNIHLNNSQSKKWCKKYWLECWSCHWTEKSAPTIGGAIRKWNRRTCWKEEQTHEID